MKKVYYLGTFPPPYGGVTKKNLLLYTEISQRYKELKSIKEVTIAGLLKPLLTGQCFLIGSGGTSKLKRITQFIGVLRPKAQRKSIVFVMGGTIAEELERNPVIIGFFKRYKCLYVETMQMVNQLKALGLENVSFFPNCRRKPQNEIYPTDNRQGKLKCVFFSSISPSKGVDIVLEAAGVLPQVRFDFYGHIEKGYENAFLQQVNGLKNTVYQGVFSGQDEDVYKKLNGYDILLLPTRWKAEGVPGVLVEAKIAALPAIVSDICFNSEIVEDGVSGVVLRENIASDLVDVINRLDEDREMLFKLKNGAKNSSKIYYIDDYIDEIVENLLDI